MNCHKIKYILFFICLTNVHSLRGQSIDSSAQSIINWPSISLSYLFPSNNLKSQFGNFSAVGGHWIRKSAKNWTYGLQAHYYFGSNVKEDPVLQSDLAPNGFLLNYSGQRIYYSLELRGFSFGINFGKTIPISINHSLSTRIECGYLEHRIKYDFSQEQVPQLTSKIEGYDRLQGGGYLKEKIAWLYHKAKWIHFELGIVASQAKVINLRQYDYATQKKLSSPKIEGSFGIELIWMLPILTKKKGKYFVY